MSNAASLAAPAFSRLLLRRLLGAAEQGAHEQAREHHTPGGAHEPKWSDLGERLSDPRRGTRDEHGPSPVVVRHARDPIPGGTAGANGPLSS